ncbi:hypothetical protein NDU88_001597 [Pleurodeles waltl]|uniref:Secreted protein n=1 Tax=Pleurodeles waltl TaxID=8319 RepID=A0AAV7U6W3_PLEWA|nr:hypothetical protein NDU88_001597 [Pleurodeles waltl]
MAPGWKGLVGWCLCMARMLMTLFFFCEVWRLIDSLGSGTVIWGGDFNVVLDPERDRESVTRPRHSAAAAALKTVMCGGRGRATKNDGRLIRELRVAANTGGAEMARKHTVHGDTRSDNRCAPVRCLETP